MSDRATTAGIDGLPLDVAVETVLDEWDVEDAETVRETLQRVTDDGVVSEQGAADAHAHLSKVVATPETRIELAERALADTRQTAEPYTDGAVVQTRLDRLEARLHTVRDRSEELGSHLDKVIDSEHLYDTAVGIRTLREEADNVQTAADDLLLDVRRFESWIRDPAIRYDHLQRDAELLEGAVDDLASRLDQPAEGDPEAMARTWVELAMHHRTLGLMLTDLRWELDGVQRIDERQGVEGDSKEIEQHIRGISERLSNIRDCLADVATVAARNRHEEQVLALERVLDEKEPPIEWGEIQRVFEQHRETM